MTRLLIVDDDADTLETLAIVLEDQFDVVTARNGRDALLVIHQQIPDIVLLDLTMPVMNGETLIEKMRSSGVDVPVVLVSGDPDLRLLAARLNVDYIVKPYDIGRLVAKIMRSVGSASR